MVDCICNSFDIQKGFTWLMVTIIKKNGIIQMKAKGDRNGK